MAPTHVFASLLLASPLLLVSPESALLVFIPAFIGGFFPDLDLFFGIHRKSLHFPMMYLSLAVFSGILAAVYTTNITIVLAAFTIGICSHVFGDILGAGLEHKPWEKTSDKGVYNHMSEEWISPTHIIGYDGSLKDLFVLILMSPVVFYMYRDIAYMREFVASVIVIGIIYSILRKILPEVEKYLYKNTKIGRFLIENFLHDSESDKPWKVED